MAGELEIVMKDAASRIALATQPYLFQNSFILKDLPERDLATILVHSIIKEIKKGEFLFKEGGFPKGVYWLLKGKVKIFQQPASGKRQTHYIYSDGDLIGHRQFIAEEAHPVSAVAMENGEIRFIPGDIFRGLLQTSPQFARNMLSALAREFTVWMNRMTVLQNYPVRERLILTLLILHEQFYYSGYPMGTILMTRTNLSEYVGASLETVVRLLNTLKARGLIRISGRQIILEDVDGLLNSLTQ